MVVEEGGVESRRDKCGRILLFSQREPSKQASKLVGNGDRASERRTRTGEGAVDGKKAGWRWKRRKKRRGRGGRGNKNSRDSGKKASDGVARQEESERPGKSRPRDEVVAVPKRLAGPALAPRAVPGLDAAAGSIHSVHTTRRHCTCLRSYRDCFSCGF